MTTADFANKFGHFTIPEVNNFLFFLYKCLKNVSRPVEFSTRLGQSVIFDIFFDRYNGIIFLKDVLTMAKVIMKAKFKVTLTYYNKKQCFYGQDPILGSENELKITSMIF